ncbi:hypothetical protein PG989_011639 [Apiospora arundinis]|uniref:Uncharacterized protein n=1 Tax=Apiospora arundinis TaxID=335852 RepID=A0ABR2HS49_9PEZI
MNVSPSVLDDIQSRSQVRSKYRPSFLVPPELRIPLHTEPTPHEFDSAPGISTLGTPVAG